jgi:hypothetical protein
MFSIIEQSHQCRDATPTGCCPKTPASPQAPPVSSPSQPSSSMAASLTYSLISPQGTAQSQSLEPRVRLRELVPPSIARARRPPFFSLIGSSTAPRRRSPKTTRLLKSPPRAGGQQQRRLLRRVVSDGLLRLDGDGCFFFKNRFFVLSVHLINRYYK